MAKRRQNIELRHLRYFLAAAEQGSFRRAGTTLAVQESAISRRIRDLEDQLGASLFQRHNGGVRLTLAGEHFLRRAQAALGDLREGARDVAAFGRAEAGRIKIGVLPAPASIFLVNLLRAYDRQHGGIDIDFFEGEPLEHVSAIRRHDIDVAFLANTEDWPGCDKLVLWTEQLFVALSDKHRLAGRSGLEWHDLAGESFLVADGKAKKEHLDPLDQRPVEVEPRPAIGLPDLRHNALLPLVALGRALALTSETMTTLVFPGVVYRPIGGETLQYGAIWSPRNDNPALRRLLSLARTQASQGLDLGSSV